MRRLVPRLVPRQVRFGLAALALVAAGAACASLGDATAASFDGENDRAPGSSGGSAPGAGMNEPSSVVQDNGVIIVHAAQSRAFRLCFASALGALPAPDAKLMPEANVVGVDVGTAVRIDPLAGPPGDVFVVDEEAIRGLYVPGQTPLSCQTLLSLQLGKSAAVNVGSVTADLSRGIHLLVVTGCPADPLGLQKHSTARCGATWTKDDGNLHVVHKGLQGFPRGTPGQLPVQVMHLSQPLEATRAGRPMTVEFGKVPGMTASDAIVATGVELVTDPAPGTPSGVPLDDSDAAVYGDVGFRVRLGALGDAGAETVLEQSLASIQALSAPRDVPPSYYAKASNFVLLLLGDPTLQADAGAEDPLRRLHLLAVPVVEPKADAGADGGDAGP